MALFDVCERSFWHWTTIPVGDMRDADRGVGLVHVLPARTARAVRVDAELGLVDLDRGVVGQERCDDDLRERGMPAVRRVERRLAHEAMHAALRLQRAVRVLALDRHRGRLEARLLARARLDRLGLEAAVGGPAKIQP